MMGESNEATFRENIIAPMAAGGYVDLLESRPQSEAVHVGQIAVPLFWPRGRIDSCRQVRAVG
jgi:hypothetical protein